MKKPEIVSRGRKQKYDWGKLQKAGDFFELPEANESQASSVRILANRQGLEVTVCKMKKGGFLVELLEDREK